jgi:hypothetical protein
LVETALNITVIRFTQDGKLVKSMLVPLVDATEVPETTEPLTPFTTTVPVPAGNESVLEPATAGADNVIVPLVSPDITTDAIFIPYKTTQRLPLAIVTATPLDNVIGPALIAELPLAIV